MLWLALLTAPLASAGELDRPHVPASGIAAEGGPGGLWVNPANLAFDPDVRYSISLARELMRDAPSDFALTAGVGGVGVGVHNVGGSAGDWSVHYASALQLPERLSVGFQIAWHLVGGGNNHVSYDVGASWRPLPWFGVGAVARNVGSPDPRGLIPASSGGGFALRPFGQLAVFAADYVHRFDSDRGTDIVRATARIRPVRGLYLRASVETTGVVGGGVEVYFGRVGVGSYLDHTGEAWRLSSFIGTDEPGEALFRGGHRVPALAIPNTAPPYTESTSLLARSSGPTWLQTLDLLRSVEDDPGAEGVLISLGATPMAWARYQELRDRVVALEQRGKHVIVYLHGTASTQAYYVASAASEIVAHPAGTLELVGVSAQLVNLGATLRMLGIEQRYVRRSEYKTAVDQLSRSTPSDEALEQTGALLDDTWDVLVRGIAEGRGKSTEEVRAWIDGGPYAPKEALDLGLVDSLSYPDAVDDRLPATLGRDVRIQRLERKPTPRSGWEEPAQIGIVYIEGVIVSGRSSLGGLLGARTTGSRTVVEALAKARKNTEVRAVVLRIDSPGGSAFASDEIWRAVRLVQRDGKPVVVSMGGVAASGGYYIAAPADAIWAEPTTITGSIGVFSSQPVVSSLLERLGVTTTTLVRGANAALLDATVPWTPAQRARMEALVDATYTQFKDRVAEGRKLDPERVEEVARGRVWSGTRAVEIGLADALGGLPEAVDDARRRSGLGPGRDFAVVDLVDARGPLSTVLPALQRGARVPREVSELRRVLLDALGPLSTLSVLADDRLWMIAPIDLEVR